jgi:MFS family permease
VLAVVAVPAAYVARHRPREAFAVGVLVFAGASLACGLAPSFEVLVGARCIQALGGALIVTAALDLLSETTEDDSRAARTWVAAGVLGAALGPAAGGILTQTLGWQSIFLVQVPLALCVLLAVRGVSARPVPAPAGRPHLSANTALLLLSGGLVAALFLIVLLLVEGWGMEPAAAGVVAGGGRDRLGRSLRVDRRGDKYRVGVVLVAGAASLAFLPAREWGWIRWLWSAPGWAWHSPL